MNVDWFDATHLAWTAAMILEAAIFVYKLREEGKKKERERLDTQHMVGSWHTSIREKVNEIRAIGEQIQCGVEKKFVMTRLKAVLEDIQLDVYNLMLFTSDDPASLARGLAFLYDRKEKVDVQLLKILQVRLDEKKGKEYLIVLSRLDEIIGEISRNPQKSLVAKKLSSIVR